MSALMTLLRMPSTVVRYRGLMRHLVYREIHGKVTGSMLGVGWLVLQPLLLLGMYTVVFGVFMKSRWDTQGGGIASFALALFPGLLVFNIFSECVNRAAGLILQNPNYVKKVVFPLELLIVPVIAGALIQFLIGFSLWMALVAVIQGGVSWAVLLVPLYLAPFIVLISGLCWILAAVGVYFRDLTNLVPLVTQVLMFMSPVLYPITNVPLAVRPLLYINPLTLVVEAVRGSGMSGGVLIPPEFIIYSIGAFIMAWIGIKLFNGLRPGFADVV